MGTKTAKYEDYGSMKALAIPALKDIDPQPGRYIIYAPSGWDWGADTEVPPTHHLFRAVPIIRRKIED